MMLQVTAQVTHTISIPVNQPENCQTLSLDDFKNKGFQLFPNPAREQITIESKSLESIKEIIIYNLLGQEIKNVKFFSNLTKTVLNVKNIDKGIYFLQVKTSQKRYNYKIVIDHE